MVCFVFVCDQDERVIGRYAAPGACPYCGGAVQVVDVENRWRFCFVPLYNKSKRVIFVQHVVNDSLSNPETKTLTSRDLS